MKTQIALAAMTAAMLLAVACGQATGRGDAPAVGQATLVSGEMPLSPRTSPKSCAVESASICTEFRRTGSLDLEKAMCEGARGVFANATCGDRGVVGTCATGARGEGGARTEIKRYYAPGYTADSAKTDCESELLAGTFTAMR